MAEGAKLSTQKRPLGVTLLALAFLWIGCLGTLFFPLFLIFGMTGAMWDLMSANGSQSVAWRLLVHVGKYPFLVTWFLFYVAYACIGFGLWKLRNWARLAGIGLSVFGAVLSVLVAPFVSGPSAPVFAVTAWGVLLFLWFIFYLKRPRLRFAFGLDVRDPRGSVYHEPPPGMSNAGKVWTAAAAVATLAVFMVPLFFAVESEMRQSQIYQMSLITAEGSPCVVAKVGKPIKPGWMFVGSLSDSDTTGSAQLQIPIEGPKGKGTLVVSGEKQAGTWRIKDMTLVERDQRMQLVPSTTGSCQ